MTCLSWFAAGVLAPFLVSAVFVVILNRTYRGGRDDDPIELFEDPPRRAI